MARRSPYVTAVRNINANGLNIRRGMRVLPSAQRSLLGRRAGGGRGGAGGKQG